MTTALTIGEVARRSGVPAKTIRYYEQVNLVPAPQRADNGYRVYGERAVRVLRFIKRARDLGFAIDEVAELLALWEDESRASAEVKHLVERHVEQVDRKIAELRGLRDALSHLAACCHGDDRPDCPILEDLAHGP